MRAPLFSPLFRPKLHVSATQTDASRSRADQTYIPVVAGTSMTRVATATNEIEKKKKKSKEKAPRYKYIVRVFVRRIFVAAD